MGDALESWNPSHKIMILDDSGVVHAWADHILHIFWHQGAVKDTPTALEVARMEKWGHDNWNQPMC